MSHALGKVLSAEQCSSLIGKLDTDGNGCGTRESCCLPPLLHTHSPLLCWGALPSTPPLYHAAHYTCTWCGSSLYVGTQVGKIFCSTRRHLRPPQNTFPLATDTLRSTTCTLSRLAKGRVFWGVPGEIGYRAANVTENAENAAIIRTQLGASCLLFHGVAQVCLWHGIQAIKTRP